MKHVLCAALCAALLLATAIPALATSTVTAAQAKTAAQAYVPTDSTYLYTEDDGSWYEVKFYSASRKERYDLDVSKATGKLVSFDSDADDSQGAASTTLSEADAKKAVTGEIADTSSLSAYIEWDDGFAKYKVAFTAATCYGEYEVHAQSGRVLERDITIGTRPSVPQGSQGTQSAPTADILTAEKITQLALEQVPGGIVTDIDYDYKIGRSVYEVEVYKDYVEYDLMFDAVTGALLYNRTEHEGRPGNTQGQGHQGGQNSSSQQDNYIGAEKAKQIALANAPAGATVYHCEFDYDDGRAVYEGELRNGRWECDFTIDAVSGTILEWDIDYDD